MDKKKISRKSPDKKKKSGFRIKFSIPGMIVIFILSFASCFGLYMFTANVDDDFMKNEFGGVIVEADEAPEQPESEQPEEVQPATKREKKEVTNPVPQSDPVDPKEYLASACLVTDSTLLSMADHSDLKNVIGSAELSTLTCNTAKIEGNYGTVTVYETLKIKKPASVYILLGKDIGTAENNELLAEYTKLIKALQTALPDMEIYVLQYPPVMYDIAPLTNEAVNQFNEQLLSLANKLQVHCLDTSTSLKSVDGNLAEEYWDTETGAFSDTIYKKICNYILTHVADK